MKWITNNLTKKQKKRMMKMSKPNFGFLANVGQKSHASELWHTGQEPKLCTNCSFTEDIKKFEIRIHPDVYGAIFRLLDVIKVEWQLLLTGSVRGQVVYVTGYYVPKQEVTSASVTNQEAIDQEFINQHEIVATIHSHSDMQVFFSGVDERETCASFIKHHVVINNKTQTVAKSRVDLPCGMHKFVDAKVLVMIPTVSAPLQGEEKITVKNFKYNGGGWEGNTFKGHGDWQREYNADNFVKCKDGVWRHKDWLTQQQKDELKEGSDDVQIRPGDTLY